jgi:DNA invertase Pin-like site-specific DNA recombinase
MAGKKKPIEAFGYMRTSSATNVGTDKDSEKRQRVAIESYAKHAGLVIVDWFYDPNVKGADHVTARPGFAKMLDRVAGNGVKTIVVESPDRFAGAGGYRPIREGVAGGEAQSGTGPQDSARHQVRWPQVLC